MALVLQSGNLVWQKVAKALGNTGHPVVAAAFKALRDYIVSQKSNPDLQFYFFDEAQCDAAGGTALTNIGACTLYGVYVKKASAATDNYFKIYDDATDDTTAGDQIIALPLLSLTQVAFEIYP